MSIYRGAGGAGDAVNDSSSEATLIQQLAIEAQDSADAAATSETNAAASETAAASSASAASTSASNAATSATNASNSASSASTSATNAANSATAAQTAETAAELAETNAETAETNAETAASAASTSASNAATSATNASNSASSASTSATNASNSASAASTSASNASTSATAAAGSASSASTSASNASTSATNASNSATSASTSASTATTQAGIATTKAGEAATSATNAATSATNASNSASSASTSATNASNSASSAATSATNAAASYDAFDDRYLGSKSSAPTLDNDGNALLTGALYFNTVDNAMKVYNGSAWLDAYASLSGALIATNNLADLTNTGTARTNLGLGTIATQAASNVAITGGAIDGTTVGATTASSGRFTSLSDSGNLTFTGTGNRITGDFNSGTLTNRVLFQTSTTNANTVIGVITNGTGVSSQLALYASSDPSNAAWLQVGAGANSGTEHRIAGTQTGTGSFLPITMHAGGAERLRIDTSGNVGIGNTVASTINTENNAGNLVVGAGNTTEGITVYSGNTSIGSLAFADGTTTTSTYAGYLSYFHASDTMTFGTGATERMRIDSSGNVGIGTSSPSVPLAVYKASDSAINIQNSTSGVTNVDGLQLLLSGSNGYMWNYESGANIFGTANAERMRIDSSGNVAIGNSSTNNRFLVYTAGVNASYMQVGNGSTGVGATQGFRLGTQSGGSAELITDVAMLFSTGNTERMRITSGGFVGIGASSPNYQLEIRSADPRIGLNNTTYGTWFTSAGWTGADDYSIVEEGVAERFRLTNTGNLMFNSGYGSVATAYGCRAWVNFNGTGTVAIRASGNVSSITDNNTGDYTVNFTNAMPDANYAPVIATSKNPDVNYIGINSNTSTGGDVAPTTTACRISFSQFNVGAKDPTYISFIAVR